MSAYTPTTATVRELYGHGGSEEAFDRWLAEVERAAAEKALRKAALSGRFGTNAQSVLLELADSALAWNQGYLAASRDFMQNMPFETSASNPYRRNEGENE